MKRRPAHARACGANIRPQMLDVSLLSVLSFADTLGELKDMNKGLWKKLQEKFTARSPEEKQKVWAQSLSRPRT